MPPKVEFRVLAGQLPGVYLIFVQFMQFGFATI